MAQEEKVASKRRKTLERELEWIKQPDELENQNKNGSSVEAMKEMKAEAFQ